MNSMEVCVDASLAIKVVVPEAGSDKADAFIRPMGQRGDTTHCSGVLRSRNGQYSSPKGLLRQELSADEAQRAFTSLRALPIKTRHSPEQRERAWEIASEFQLPTVYDATYLALAELGQCEFWTADEKLFKRVSDKLTFVQWLGNYSPVG